MNVWTPINKSHDTSDNKFRRSTRPVVPIISDKTFLNPPSLSSVVNSPLSGSPKCVTMSTSEASILLGKIKRIQDKIVFTKSQIISNTEMLLTFISNLKKKALNEVLEAEFEIQALSLKLEKGQSVEIEFISIINSLSLSDESSFLNFDKVQEALESTYKVSEEFKSIATIRKSIKKRNSFDHSMVIRRSKTELLDFKGIQNKLVCAKNYKDGLIAIDLLNYSQTNIPFAPKILPYSICCRIEEGKYFFNGGYTGEKTVGNSYIIDFSASSYEIVQSSIERDGGGSVHKDDKIFVFGGIHSKLKDLADCQYFDLFKKKWVDITPLPIASHANTATSIEEWIILTGYHLAGVYIFTGNSYTSLIPLQAKRFKYIFESWVLDDSCVYELQDLANNLWVSFECGKTLKLGWLYSFSGFRNSGYIYFVDDANGICRLDTDKKTVEVIVNLEKD